MEGENVRNSLSKGLSHGIRYETGPSGWKGHKSDHSSSKERIGCGSMRDGSDRSEAGPDLEMNAEEEKYVNMF